MRKKPYTNTELFEIIIGKLTEQGLMPEHIDYAIPTRNTKEIKTYEFDVCNSLCFGGNEGIYLDIWLKSWKDDRIPLGTIKTLEESRDAMRYMATLLGDFVYEVSDFTNKNLHDFTWTGFELSAYTDDGTKYPWSFTCPTLEKALERKDEILGRKANKVVITDNSTRKEKVFEN